MNVTILIWAWAILAFILMEILYYFFIRYNADWDDGFFHAKFVSFMAANLIVGLVFFLVWSIIGIVKVLRTWGIKQLVILGYVSAGIVIIILFVVFNRWLGNLAIKRRKREARLKRRKKRKKKK